MPFRTWAADIVAAVMSTQMLDVRRLEMLLEVARTGSFAAAAESMSFTPSAVSQQMRALERASRVTLFLRGPRGVTLTEAGQALRRHAEAVTTRLAAAEAELVAMGSLGEQRLRFGSFSSATGAFAAQAYRIFCERHPAAGVSFSDGEPYEAVAMLSENQLDLAVIFELNGWPVNRDYRGVATCREPQLETVTLFDDPYLLVVAADHPLAGQASVTLEQLAGERILVSAPWEPALRRICAQAGVRPTFDGSCQGTGFEALQALVAAGSGVTLMPRLSLDWLREGLVARPLADAPVRCVQTAVRAEGGASSSIEAMAEILTGLTERLEPDGVAVNHGPEVPIVLAS